MPFAELPQTRTWYDVEGDGPPVLLIQGVAAPGRAWAPTVQGLRGRFRLAWFDNRGIGQTAAPPGPMTVEQLAADARALLDHLGWDQAHVVGHSLGGVIAQQLALDVPERVRTLSLLCTFVRGAEATRLSARMVWLGLRTRIGTRRMRGQAFLELIAPRSLLGGDREKLATEAAVLFGRELGENPPIAMTQLGALRAHDTSARLSELAPIPTLVVAADEDPIARPDQSRRLAAAIGTARYHELADAGHACVIHRAEDVNRLLAEHFGD